MPTLGDLEVAALAPSTLDFARRPEERSGPALELLDEVADRVPATLTVVVVLEFCPDDEAFGFLNATARENGSDLWFTRARLSEKLLSAELVRATVPPEPETAARERDEDRDWICAGKTMLMEYDT